jgi:(p)ppGpp synthase/HD superfamily hydrolase
MRDRLRRYSERFDRALALASIAHDGVMRKGTRIPYILHPIHVSRLLELHGFSAEVVLAGLLHDVLEDATFDDRRLQDSLVATFPEAFRAVDPTKNGFRAATEAFVTASFGERVLELVHAVTKPSQPGRIMRTWRGKREEQLRRLRKLDLDGAGLKAADALHNAQALLRDVREHGLVTLERFDCSKADLLWYYGAVSQTLRERLREHAIGRELDDVVSELTEGVNSTYRADMSDLTSRSPSH